MKWFKAFDRFLEHFESLGEHPTHQSAARGVVVVKD
jgi:hypothetical protein